jgi:hypothetical protein
MSGTNDVGIAGLIRPVSRWRRPMSAADVMPGMPSVGPPAAIASSSATNAASPSPTTP